MNLRGGLARFDAWVRRLDPKSKLLLLLLITFIVYGAATFLALLSLYNDPAGTSNQDFNVYYRPRTQVILDGGLLYRDVHTETPPLINYFLVPAQLHGGSVYDWVWCAYASFFAFLTSSMLYLALRRWDEHKAFLVGVLTLLCPFLIDESSIGEDGAIVAFVFLLATVLMLLERKNSSAVVIAVGIWTKMWSGLLLPVQFLRLRNWRDRISFILIVSVLSLAITLPFLVLCPDEFLTFLDYYFLGGGDRANEGMSMWSFLSMGGYGLPRGVELFLVIASLLIAYLYSHRKKLGVWESVTLVLIVFIVFYPKMHIGYYIIPMVLLIVWGIDNWRILARLYLAYVPLVISAGFSPTSSTEISSLFVNGWLVGFILALAGTMLFVDALRLAFKFRPFISTIHP